MHVANDQQQRLQKKSIGMIALTGPRILKLANEMICHQWWS